MDKVIRLPTGDQGISLSRMDGENSMTVSNASEKLAMISNAFRSGNPADLKRLLPTCADLDSEQFLQMLLYKGLAHPDSGVQQKCAEILSKKLTQVTDQLQALLHHPVDTIRYWSLFCSASVGSWNLNTC